MYIHEKDNWIAFRWNATELTAILEEVNRKTGFVVWQAFFAWI